MEADLIKEDEVPEHLRRSSSPRHLKAMYTRQREAELQAEEGDGARAVASGTAAAAAAVDAGRDLLEMAGEVSGAGWMEHCLPPSMHKDEFEWNWA